MKLNLILTVFLLTTCFVRGQGILIYDQQSTNLIEGGAGLDQSSQPMGQSFTPTLSSVGFVMLNLYDAGSLSIGSTVYVNLRSDSITGTILGSSAGIFLPDQFFGTTNFLFTTPISVTSGETYYLQPVIQSGDTVGSYVTDASYTGGSEILQGIVYPYRNLWFQEGTYSVPEPSSALLVLLGSGVLICVRRRK